MIQPSNYKRRRGKVASYSLLDSKHQRIPTFTVKFKRQSGLHLSRFCVRVQFQRQLRFQKVFFFHLDGEIQNIDGQCGLIVHASILNRSGTSNSRLVQSRELCQIVRKRKDWDLGVFGDES